MGSSLEFVPVEEFSLWHLLMETRHGMTISEPQVGLWMSVAEYQAEHAANDHHAGVPVTRVSFFALHKELETYAQVTRFFLTEQAAELTEILLSHYADGDGDTPTPVTTPGMCLFRRAADPPAGAAAGAKAPHL